MTEPRIANVETDPELDCSILVKDNATFVIHPETKVDLDHENQTVTLTPPDGNPEVSGALLFNNFTDDDGTEFVLSGYLTFKKWTAETGRAKDADG